MITFLYILLVTGGILILLGSYLLEKERQRRQTAENALAAIYTRDGEIDEVYYWYVGLYPEDWPEPPELTDDE